MLQVLSSNSNALNINTDYSTAVITKSSGNKLNSQGSMEVIKIGHFYTDTALGDVGLQSYVDDKSFYFASSTYNITFADNVSEL